MNERNQEKRTSNSALEHDALDSLTNTESAELSLQFMDISTLADRCMNEIKNYRRGELSNDIYGLELFRRALKERDPFAWETIQLRFNDMMLQWMRSHPMRIVACRYDSEENYVAQGFTRFWQATIGNENIQFRSLAAVLRYLRMSLNGIILDTLRVYSRPREISLPESGEPGESFVVEQDDVDEVWEVIRSLLHDERQERVAYLIYYCGLKPREIVKLRPQEFPDVQEIYQLRRIIFERLKRNADYICWRLDYQFQ
jgi:integrase